MFLFYKILVCHLAYNSFYFIYILLSVLLSISVVLVKIFL